MTTYKEVFPHKQSLLVVVHIENIQQTLENVQIAHNAGADGVFLIDHEGSREVLAADAVHEYFPDVWIGVNRLGQPVETRFKGLPPHVRGVWADNAFIDETSEFQRYAGDINSYRERDHWEGLYFGGVAFKYQRHVTDLEAAVQKASLYMDVICTSGPGTGRAAGPEKIRRMKAASDRPIAIASGVTPENVGDYPDADCFLVATGISRSFHELEPERVKALVRKLER